jgi:hypothetical protein
LGPVEKPSDGVIASLPPTLVPKANVAISGICFSVASGLDFDAVEIVT